MAWPWPGSGQAVAIAISTLSAVPAIQVHVRQESLCGTCGEGCFAESPFVNAEPSDQYGGKRPWRRYVPHLSDLECKCPHVGMCLVCYNVIRSCDDREGQLPSIHARVPAGSRASGSKFGELRWVQVRPVEIKGRTAWMPMHHDILMSTTDCFPCLCI